MVNGVDNGVEAWGSFCQHAGELRDHGGEKETAAELPYKCNASVGRPGKQPQADVGDGHFGDADLSALGIFVLDIHIIDRGNSLQKII